MSRLLKPIFLILGLLLFAWVLREVDLSRVGVLLARMGAGCALVVLTYGGVSIMDTLAWRYGFKPAEVDRIRFPQLWRIRLIGESFNAVTPFGSMGGEPVKAQLLKDHHGLMFKQGIASQVVGRTTILIALTLFLVPGTVFLSYSSSIAEEYKQATQVGLLTFSSLIGLFLLFQVTGGLGKITGWLSSRFFSKEPPEFLVHLEALDLLISEYYKHHPSRFIRSVGFGFLGWLLEMAELYLVLFFLDIQVGLGDLWIIIALAQLVRIGSFFIPLSLGAMEGGLVWIFATMGMGADVGLTVSLVRRIRELTWIGIGFLLAGGMALKPSAVAVETVDKS